MTDKTIIFWFRQDLRLADNPGLMAAATAGRVLPIYIHDQRAPGDQVTGAASRVWLHHSLRALDASLAGKLQVFQGDSAKIIRSLVREFQASGVYWNRCYEAWRVRHDAAVKTQLKQAQLDARSFNASLLWEPWQGLKQDGSPYRVFTPYFRHCRATLPPRAPLALPVLQCVDKTAAQRCDVAALKLLPEHGWHQQMMQSWRVGEQAAADRLSAFIQHQLEGYAEARDYPQRANLSRLSPHLHFGEISPHMVWDQVQRHTDSRDADRFLTQLGWREFSHSLLFHNPLLTTQCLQQKYSQFPWRNDPGVLQRWQQGQTGYPIVDAGMRELWQTGYMHNRVRMVVASFLVKNLLQDWRSGERWFRDCLLDADLANNAASWQWVAGCGADAAPYFRIFNPVTQGEKFDGQAVYTRQFVPELAALPDKYLFKPFAAPPAVLDQAGIKLGSDYPQPMVDLRASRQRALAALASLKDDTSP